MDRSARLFGILFEYMANRCDFLRREKKGGGMTKLRDKTNGEVSESAEEREGALPDNERREALKKLAKYSAYSAPALLALMKSGKAMTISTQFPGLLDGFLEVGFEIFDHTRFLQSLFVFVLDEALGSGDFLFLFLDRGRDLFNLTLRDAKLSFHGPDAIVTRVSICRLQSTTDATTDFGHDIAQQKCTTYNDHHCLSEFDKHYRNP